jgi:NAD/NADP transhydrogenase alpha subunit
MSARSLTRTHTPLVHTRNVCSYFLVSGVKPSLHTPLMSMSNAISGIVILGGMVMIQGEYLDDTDGNPTQVRCSGHTFVGHVGLGPLLWAHCR